MILINLLRVSGIPKIYINTIMNVEIGKNNKYYNIDSCVVLIEDEFECDDLKFSQNDTMDQVNFKIKIGKITKIIEFNRKINEIPERHVIPMSFEKSTLNLVFEISKVNNIDNPNKTSFSVGELNTSFFGCFSFI